MRVVAIAGEPGTGKSRLVKDLIALIHAAGYQDSRFGTRLIRGHHFKELRLLILGRYDNGEAFPGTDRLSMAVQPEAEEFLKWAASDSSPFNNTAILFEGDRLCTGSLFAELREAGVPFKLLVLSADPEVKLQRYQQRGSHQSEQFLKGRASKARYLAKVYGAEVLPNNDEFDLKVNVLRLTFELSIAGAAVKVLT